MILNSWLTTISNRIRNASSRRRLARSGNRHRFSNPAVMQAPPAFSRLSSHVRKAVWQTFDAAPRWTSDSRRFQRQVWQTYDVAPLTEALEDRTLLAVFDVTTTADVINGSDGVISLREAVIAANAAGGADTINLPPGLFALTITGADENSSATGDLDIRDETIIQSTVVGVNAIIDASGLGNDRVIHKNSTSAGSLTLNDITIQGGTNPKNNHSSTDADGYGGGGISVTRGALFLNRVIVRNNTTTGSLQDGAGLNVDYDEIVQNFRLFR